MLRNRAETLTRIGPWSIFQWLSYLSLSRRLARLFERAVRSSMEVRQRDVCPETREGSGINLVLLTLKSVKTRLENWKIVLVRILSEISWRGVLLDEPFWFQTQTQQWATANSYFERVSRNFGEKRLIGAVFLDLFQAFDTEWVDSLLYRLTFLNFPSYLVNTISSYLPYRTFEASFRTDISTRRVMRAVVAQGGIISTFLFSLYVRDMPTPFQHVKLAL